MTNQVCRRAAASLVLALSATGALAQSIGVKVNGQPVSFAGTQPRQMNGRVMVPLRGVLEQLGAVVRWDAQNRIVTATRANTEMVLPIGSRMAQVNGKNVFLDVPATTVGGSTMVPLRFVSEALGARVAWEGSTNSVSIDTQGGDREVYEGGVRTDRTADGAVHTEKPANGGITPPPVTAAGGAKLTHVTLDTGDVIPVRLDDELSSDQSQVGDKFSATVENADAAGLPAGTRFDGVVTEAIPAGKDKPGVLAVEVRQIVLANQKPQPVTAGIISLDTKSVSRSSDGRLTARAGGSKSEQWKWVGIGAGAGLLLSTVTKGNKLLDTLLGAGAGYLYNELQRKGASNVNLKPGTEIGVRIDRRLTAPVTTRT